MTLKLLNQITGNVKTETSRNVINLLRCVFFFNLLIVSQTRVLNNNTFNPKELLKMFLPVCPKSINFASVMHVSRKSGLFDDDNTVLK